jgi:hypothetical protein
VCTDALHMLQITKKMCGLGSPGGYTATPTEEEDCSGDMPLMLHLIEPDGVYQNGKKIWGFDLPGGYQLMVVLTCTPDCNGGKHREAQRHEMHRHSPDWMIHRCIFINHTADGTEETPN